MKIDSYGQLLYDEEDLCDCLMQDPDRTLSNVFVETEIKFPPELDLPPMLLTKYEKPSLSISDFDLKNQESWLMPVSYTNLDICKYVLDKCKTDTEIDRVGQELLLFQDREMFPLLRYLVYLVDTMRKYNIVWGVGRGSSVASYVLYLIGVHRINSLYFELDPTEFLK